MSASTIEFERLLSASLPGLMPRGSDMLGADGSFILRPNRQNRSFVEANLRTNNHATLRYPPTLSSSSSSSSFGALGSLISPSSVLFPNVLLESSVTQMKHLKSNSVQRQEFSKSTFACSHTRHARQHRVETRLQRGRLRRVAAGRRCCRRRRRSDRRERREQVDFVVVMRRQCRRRR
jgi:hypothetical protein